MKLNRAITEKIARLSKLNFTENELEEIQQDLQHMIGFVEKLNELDTTGVAPLTHIATHAAAPREDVAYGSISIDQALQNAPDSKDRYFTVPKVINNNS